MIVVSCEYFLNSFEFALEDRFGGVQAYSRVLALRFTAPLNGMQT